MDSELGLKDYIDMVKRRWLMMLAIFVAVVITSVSVAMLMPPVYESSGTILIESQAIPTDLVKSAVTTYADERIESIKQRVMTRENLLALIEKFGLYQKEKDSLSVTEMVDDLKSKFRIQMLSANKGKQGANSTIAFNVVVENRRPDLAHKIANELVTLFLAENVKSRTARATETTEFFVKEGERLRLELEEVEKKVAAYKQENASALPEYKDMNMAMVQRMDAALQNLDREYKSTQEELRYLDIELASAKAGIGLSDSGKQNVTPASELENMKSEYTKLIGIYTENHPSVKRLKNKIELLEKSEAADPKKNGSETKSISAATTEAALRVEKVQAQIASANVRLESLTAQKVRTQSELASLEQKIMQAPQVERGLINLLRDYENAKNKYAEIRSKEINAKMTENLEQDSKGERFALIEPPAFPEKPVRPDRLKIMLLGIFGAFAASAGMMLALESIDKRVRSAEILSGMMESPLLVSIPYMSTAGEIDRNKKRIKYLIAVIVGAILIALILVHVFYMPLDLLIAKVMARFA